MKKIRIGIIGTGSISHAHVSAYGKLDNVELAAACDINEKRVKKFCEKYSIPDYYTDCNEMLKDASIDAVSVCTWNNSHAEISISALSSGKNVLCEKPLAMNLEEAIEMQKAEKKSGKLLMVGFVKRFAKNTVIIKEFIDNGRLGEIYYAKTGCIRRCGNPTGWFADKSKSGGGPLIDLGVHMIDLCRYLMGRPGLVSVYGVTYDKLGSRCDVKMLDRYRPVDEGSLCDVEDLALAMIKFDNGSVMTVEVSFTLHTANEKLYCEIFGTNAGAEIEPEFKIAGVMDGYNVDITPLYSKDKEKFQSMFDREIAHFVHCVNTGVECLNPVEDGVELMKILDAVYKSAAAGREIRFD